MAMAPMGRRTMAPRVRGLGSTTTTESASNYANSQASIVAVRDDPAMPGRLLMDLSNGNTVTVGSFIQDSDFGGSVKAEIRADDGSLTGDGPTVTPAAAAMFQALGVDVPGVQAPMYYHPATATAPAVINNKPIDPTPPPTQSTAPVPPPPTPPVDTPAPPPSSVPTSQPTAPVPPPPPTSTFTPPPITSSDAPSPSPIVPSVSSQPAAPVGPSSSTMLIQSGDAFQLPTSQLPAPMPATASAPAESGIGSLSPVLLIGAALGLGWLAMRKR